MEDRPSTNMPPLADILRLWKHQLQVNRHAHTAIDRGAPVTEYMLNTSGRYVPQWKKDTLATPAIHVTLHHTNSLQKQHASNYSLRLPMCPL